MPVNETVTEAEPWHFSEQSLALLDGIAERIEPDDSKLEEWFRKYFKQHRQRFAADLEIIAGHVDQGARVLEYGAVPLVMTAALAERKYEVCAVDVKPERFARAIASHGLEVKACDVENETVPFATETFDAALFNELFEHLRINPIFTLREVHRVLKPGGTLILSTPNLRSLRGLRNLLFHNQAYAASAGVYQQYAKIEELGHMGHVREYTTREVAEFLHRVGFRIDKVIFRGGYGKGLVGIAERVAPSLRPFFTLVATKEPSDTPRSKAEGEQNAG